MRVNVGADSLISRFLYYALLSEDAQAWLRSQAVGSTMPNLNADIVRLLPLRIPGETAQKHIADVLTAFDELIENNRRRIEILEEAARSLYREWFVHFRFPRHETATFVDTPIGPIPESWAVVRLDSLRTSARNAIASGPFGSKLGRRDYVVEGTPVIRGQNLAVGGGFTFEGFVYVTEEKTKELATNLARPGDIVVTQRGTLGQVGLIPDESPFKQFVLSQSQMKITVDADRAEAQYVYAVLCSDEGRQRLVSRTMTSGVPHINLALFKEFDLALPPVGLQRQFTAAAKPLHHLLHHLAASAGALTAARDLLLPKLVTGAIDVDSLGVDDVFGWAELAAEAG